MRLPESDENYLNNKGFKWRIVPDGNGACLVISDIAVSTSLFDRPQTELMIRIPTQYNIAGLDMFYVTPDIKLRSTGAYPEAASTFEDHCGQRWQRFSRHLTTTPWRAGVDGLPMFLALIQRELQGKG